MGKKILPNVGFCCCFAFCLFVCFWGWLFFGHIKYTWSITPNIDIKQSLQKENMSFRQFALENDIGLLDSTLSFKFGTLRLSFNNLKWRTYVTCEIGLLPRCRNALSSSNWAPNGTESQHWNSQLLKQHRCHLSYAPVVPLRQGMGFIFMMIRRLKTSLIRKHWHLRVCCKKKSPMLRRQYQVAFSQKPLSWLARRREK